MMPAGSASTTRSNSSPFACGTVSSAAGESRDSGRSPVIASGIAAASSATRASGAITARRPLSAPPMSARSARTVSATEVANGEYGAARPAAAGGGTRITRGGVPSERTESGGCSPGATAASTSAATTMISAGVR